MDTTADEPSGIDLDLDLDLDLEELTRLALAADADAPIPDDAIPFAEAFSDGTADATAGMLPSWYMPTPGGTVHTGRGWRRVVALVSIASFLAINAAGLCSTYGWPTLG